MKKMLIVWVFLATILFCSLYFIGINYSKSYTAYRELEADMKESAHVYLELNEIKLEINESIKINANKMLEAKVLENLSVDEDECEGYVMVKRGIKEYEYTSFIKCNEYTTIDYE